MFGIFSNKKEKLEKKYKQLMTESYQLSTSDRASSDRKLAEANEVLQQIEALEKSDT